METLKERYNALIKEAVDILKDVINTSDLKSDHCDCKVIPTFIEDYPECIIIDDKLQVYDTYGNKHSIFHALTLAEIMDIADIYSKPNLWKVEYYANTNNLAMNVTTVKSFVSFEEARDFTYQIIDNCLGSVKLIHPYTEL